MKTTFTLAALVLMGTVGVSAASADCELSCIAECKQEAAICNGATALDAKIGRQVCETEYGDAVVLCEADALDSRADCVGSCGPDLKECVGEAKAVLKECKATAKIALAGCLNEVATLAESDRAACAEESASCSEGCTVELQ